MLENKKLEIPVDQTFGSEENSLACPRCNALNLHHYRVTVYSRNEDDELTMVTEVSEDQVISGMIPSINTRNPSRRRDGLAVQFYCEHCDYITELTISQHKGTSYVHWRTLGERIQASDLSEKK